MAATERAATIKRLQEEAQACLPPNALYIALWIRNDPPPENDFHWAFYHHKHPRTGGVQHDAVGVGSGWITNHTPTAALMKSNFLCVLIQVACDITEPKAQQLDRILRSYDDTLNEISGVTCRVWMFTVLPRLVESGLVCCDDLAALEMECKAIGNGYRLDAARNVQPRPVVVSKLCF